MEPLLRLTGADDIARSLVDVWGRARPREPLTPAEVSRIIRADPGLVLATPSLSGIIAVTRRGSADAGRGHIRLLAVDPAQRRRGEASALLDAAQAWLIDQGASAIRWGAEAPWYLWPGIDSTWHEAVSLARYRGFRQTGQAVNLALATDFQAPTPAGIVVDRLSRSPAHAAQVSAARAMVTRNWPPWLVEVDLAIDSGTLFVAFSGDAPLAFMAHSTLRHGWLGPMGTEPDHQRRGAGRAVLSAACADLAQRGVATAQIAWVGPVSYFTDLGARQCRTFLQMQMQLPDRGRLPR